MKEELIPTPAEELERINEVLEDEIDIRDLAEATGAPTPEREAALEESEAEKVRERYMRDLVRGAAENLMAENDALEEQRNNAERLATKDPLTGIDNLRGFEEALRKMASRVSPSESIHRRKDELETMTVMFADVDHFKKINDSYGHDVGDEVLKAVASQLKGLMRTEDIVARYGGEEFVLVFEDASQEEILKKFGSKLPEIDITLPKGESITVTMSAGVAEYHPKMSGEGKPKEQIEAGISEAIKKADEAMYQAKKNGRNQIVAAEE